MNNHYIQFFNTLFRQQTYLALKGVPGACWWNIKERKILEVETIESIAVGEIEGVPNSRLGDLESWVTNITCPRCGAPTEPTGKVFAFGAFDGRGYHCNGCGKYFSAYYRDHVFSHTVPKAEVELIDPEKIDVHEPEAKIIEVEEDEAVEADTPPPLDEEPRVQVEEGLGKTEVLRPPPSTEEVIESLRVLNENVTFIGELSVEEAHIVKAFFLDFIKIITAFDGAPQIDVSILPQELEEIERANITAKGGLLILFRDGLIESIDLSRPENRDLLVAVIHNTLLKLGVLSTRKRMMIEKRLKYLTTSSKELQKIASSLPDGLKPSTYESFSA